MLSTRKTYIFHDHVHRQSVAVGAESWEKGRDVFERHLIDHDWSLNNANWQWLSASTFFHQYFRVYSPVTFGKKYDKSGAFIRKFVPALRNMPDKYIYEPWKAPKDVQERAGCIIGKDYPKPIVDHETAKKRCLDRMAKVRGKAVGGASAGRSFRVSHHFCASSVPVSLSNGGTQSEGELPRCTTFKILFGILEGRLGRWSSTSMLG